MEELERQGLTGPIVPRAYPHHMMRKSQRSNSLRLRFGKRSGETSMGWKVSSFFGVYDFSVYCFNPQNFKCIFSTVAKLTHVSDININASHDRSEHCVAIATISEPLICNIYAEWDIIRSVGHSAKLISLFRTYERNTFNLVCTRITENLDCIIEGRVFFYKHMRVERWEFHIAMLLTYSSSSVAALGRKQDWEFQ